MRALTSSLVFLSLACQPPQPVEPPVSPPPDCRVEVPAGLTGRQGARVTVPLTLGVDVTNLRVERLVSLSDSVEGGELHATLPYGAASAKVVLGSDCDGAGQLRDVDFTVTPLTWSRAAEWTGAAGPTAREYFSMWLDPNDANRMLLYGGFVYVPQQFTPDTGLWELDLSTSTWRALTAAGSPPTVAGGRLALAADGRSGLYFGGVDVSTGAATPYVLERLSLDGSGPAWSDASASTTGGRGEYQPAFFFDAKRDRFLSLCGVSDAVGYHCQVRELVNGAWNTVATEGTAPGGRNGHAWAYDAQTDRVVLFGGDIQGTTLGDTWVLDLSVATPRWTMLFERSPVAVARRNMAYALDSKNHRFFIWGGTGDGQNAVPGLQVLDLSPGAEAWSEVGTDGVAPVSRASGAAVFDASRNRLLMGFGNSLAGQYADLWSLEL